MTWRSGRSTGAGSSHAKIKITILSAQILVENLLGSSLLTGSSYSSDYYRRCTPRLVIEQSWETPKFFIILHGSFLLLLSFHFSMSLCAPNAAEVTIHNVMFSAFSPYVLPFTHHVNNN